MRTEEVCNFVFGWPAGCQGTDSIYGTHIYIYIYIHFFNIAVSGQMLLLVLANHLKVNVRL